MLIRYAKSDGSKVELHLTDRTITIGRSQDADVVVDDERSSRIHCGIRLVDEEYVVKDLKSKNGTFVNNQRVESHALKPGDRIRVGGTVFVFEQEQQKGATTMLHEMEQEMMSEGKGYKTILREIVDDVKTPSPAPPRSTETEPGK